MGNEKQALDEKVHYGYWYAISSEDMNAEKQPSGPTGERKVVAHTGKGGVDMYIKKCRDLGMPDELIGESIWMQMTYNNITKWIPLNILNVKTKPVKEGSEHAEENQQSEEDGEVEE